MLGDFLKFKELTVVILNPRKAARSIFEFVERAKLLTSLGVDADSNSTLATSALLIMYAVIAARIIGSK